MLGGITAGSLTLACLVLIEAPPRISRYFSKKVRTRCENISILDTTFIYGSCPDNIYLRKPGPDYPSMISTTSCTDSVGGRIDCYMVKEYSNETTTYILDRRFIYSSRGNRLL